MKKILLLACLLGTVFSIDAQNIRYASGNNSWNADSLGNHRAVISFAGEGNIAKTLIPWRRRDKDPQAKRIIIQDAKTKQLILNFKTGSINNESGEIYFEPVSGKGAYYVYYMPYKNEGRSNYPKGVYLSPLHTADDAWESKIRTGMPVNTTVTEIQAVDDFNSFYPMEVIATAKETAAIIASGKNKSFLVFPEDRIYPIKMTDRLPQRWIRTGASETYSGTAKKGENYTYQLGIYALKDLADLSIRFTDLKQSNGATIKADFLSCINTSGVKYDRSAFSQKLAVEKGKIQALWCVANIPQNATPGVYSGKAILTAKGVPAVTLTLKLTVANTAPLQDGGISEPWKQTRLNWLNSELAQENNVIAPYTPLKIKDNTIELLGRKVELNSDGFPKQIQTFFTPEMTGYQDNPNNLLAEGIHFHFTKKEDGKDLKLTSQGLKYLKQEAGTVKWTATSTGEALQMEVNGALEFDGFASFTVKVKAIRDIDLKEMTMHIPFNRDAAKYMMGLGQKGSKRPENINWKWDVATKNQDGAWVGNVNAGLQYSLRDERYTRPLNTNFYLQKPLLLPSSWGNENKGGITIAEKGISILANNYSGERSMKKGDSLFFNFTLLITPFHPIDTDFQWETRFYHRYNSVDTIKATGATVVNIHHANAINPWINYPFIEYKKMKAFIDEAHSKGLKVKIYNTVRELSNKAYETFPLRSLGHEIYSPGKGGGFSWLQEHIGDDYIAAWFVPELKDAAIVNSGMSRWHNYYVEGMNWLVQHVGIDGIYLDDVAFDRITMKRIKRVLTKDGHPGIIDLHSANQFNKSDGFNNSGNLYMEHFPYLNRLWFGEYFEYEKESSDFFLTEVSGIPFGLMGEMLQDGGNQWRGMLYGMTNRLPWSDDADPRQLWKLWDDFGMKGSAMIGYWSENCPVKTDNEKVLATVYRKNGTALISIASWAPESTDVRLKIDWKALGIDPAKADITVPDIRNFQTGRKLKPDEAVRIEKNKGLIVIVK